MKRFIPHTLCCRRTPHGGVRATAQMKTAYFMEGSRSGSTSMPHSCRNGATRPSPAWATWAWEANSNFLSVRNFLYPRNRRRRAGDLSPRLGRQPGVPAPHAPQQPPLRSTCARTFRLRRLCAPLLLVVRCLNPRSESSDQPSRKTSSRCSLARTGAVRSERHRHQLGQLPRMAMGFCLPDPHPHEGGDDRIPRQGTARTGACLGASTAWTSTLNDREWRADLRGSVNANVAGMNFGSPRPHRAPRRNGPSRPERHRPQPHRQLGPGVRPGRRDALPRRPPEVSLGSNDLGFVCWSKMRSRRYAQRPVAPRVQRLRLRPRGTSPPRRPTRSCSTSPPHGTARAC